MNEDSINAQKQELREDIWALLERSHVARGAVHGRIPDFVGADRAAELLVSLDAWRAAHVVKSNPDRAQYPARVAALRDGKLLYLAVPRMAEPDPFYLLDPGELVTGFDVAATADGARAVASTIGLDRMRPVDLVVCGSVAVNPDGARIGKGAGYSDIEVALLVEAGLIRSDTVIVSTVHDLQVIADYIPESRHDFRVDVVVTPTRVITCGSPYRPDGLVLGHLTADKAQSIPVLRQRYGH